jgi:mannose-6-phosphate isomerase-like protein (cupin superfamily)
MPVIRAAEGTEYEVHGATFTAYANAATGSAELCAWNLNIPAGQPGVEHRISKEELFLIKCGTPRISVDGAATDLAAGDVAVAPAGCLLKVENPGSQASDIWVTTGAGLSATLPDGSRMSPPWAQ